MNWPKISIVTPSYNQGIFLEETINSVLGQNYPNLEYIVIDGGSKDNSPEIIKSHATKLAYYVIEPDKGQADAINKGLRQASGDIIAWINSDDLLLPNALKTVAEYFIKHPESNVVTGMRKVINAKSQWLFNWFQGWPEPELLRLMCTVFQETTFWRSSVYQKIGELDASYHYALDYDYWQRILAAGYRFDFIPQFFGAFRTHEMSKGSTLVDVRTNEVNRIYQKYAIAENADDAQIRLDQLLGQEWQQKYLLLRDLGHKSISNRPTVLTSTYRLLFSPYVGDWMASFHKIYNQRKGRYVYSR